MNRWRHKRRERDHDRAIGVRGARLVLLALVLTSLLGVLILVLPYLHAMILAVVLGSILAPLHRRLQRWLGGRENIAAAIAVLLVALLIIVPTTLFFRSLIRQGLDTVDKAQQWYDSAQAWYKSGGQREFPVPPAARRLWRHARMKPVRDAVTQRLQAADPQKTTLVEALLRWEPDDETGEGWIETVQQPGLLRELLSSGPAALVYAGRRAQKAVFTVGRFVFGFAVMLFVMFFVFRDGARMLDHLLHLSPLTDTQEQALLGKVKEVSRAVFLGVFGTAFVQALVAMMAFKIVGIPALLWGTLLGLASIVPNLGVVIWAPAVAYLLLTGHPGYAVFLALWCMLVVGSVDNVLRPLFMGGGAGMSYLMIFFAILGGLQCFGPVGVIYGPLIFGLCAVSLYIYELDNATFLARQDRL